MEVTLFPTIKSYDVPLKTHDSHWYTQSLFVMVLTAGYQISGSHRAGLFVLSLVTKPDKVES